MIAEGELVHRTRNDFTFYFKNSSNCKFLVTCLRPIFVQSCPSLGNLARFRLKIDVKTCQQEAVGQLRKKNNFCLFRYRPQHIKTNIKY